jgi:hypothetical protein
MAVPLMGSEQAIHHSKAKMLAQQSIAAGERRARVQQLDAYSPEDFSNTVQLGDKDHAWKEYEPEESVMGKPYEDTPFSATLQSSVVHNPSREFDVHAFIYACAYHMWAYMRALHETSMFGQCLVHCAASIVHCSLTKSNSNRGLAIAQQS